MGSYYLGTIVSKGTKANFHKINLMDKAKSPIRMTTFTKDLSNWTKNMAKAYTSFPNIVPDFKANGLMISRMGTLFKFLKKIDLLSKVLTKTAKKTGSSKYIKME